MGESAAADRRGAELQAAHDQEVENAKRQREIFLASIDKNYQELAKAVDEKRWADAARLGSDFAKNGQSGHKDVQQLTKSAAEGTQAELAAEAKARQEQIDAAMAKLETTKDDMQRVTWSKSPSAPRIGSPESFLSIYFGRPDQGKPYLRMIIPTSGEDWLFTKQVQVRVGDIDHFIAKNVFEWKREHNAGQTWEWLDIPVDQDGMAVVESIMEGKEVKIRFKGDTHVRDFVVNDTLRQSITDVYAAWRLIAP